MWPTVLLVGKIFFFTKADASGHYLTMSYIVGAFLLTIGEQRRKLKTVFESMHPKWQKEQVSILRDQQDPLLEILLRIKKESMKVPDQKDAEF
jgi:hypothetical protein